MSNKVVWLTGPSGVGKTTVAKKIQEDLPCIILDGDEMRKSVSLGAGFSLEERQEHNYRIARLAHVLSQQMIVIVAVIAPAKEVRSEIDKICSPEWVYVKRTIEEKKNNFYEEPEDYFTIDHDTLSPEESAITIREHIGFVYTGEYSLFIGRYQPFHEGHATLMRTVLDKGGKVCIGLRESSKNEQNPYSNDDRTEMIRKIFPEEMENGRVVVSLMPDLKEVCYGRQVGWGMRRIRLPEEIENISATKIRWQETNTTPMSKQ